MSGFLRLSYVKEVPTSIQVMGDLITYGPKLDGINKELRNYEASTEKKFELIQEIPKKLEDIINVYNINVERIQTGCSNIKSFEYPTYDQWLENNPIFLDQWPSIKSDSTCANLAKKVLKPNYDKGRAEAENHYLKNLGNNYILAQTAPSQLDLKKKIEKVIERARVQTLPIEQLPKLKELAEYDDKMKERVEGIVRELKDKLTTVSLSDAAAPLKLS